MEKVYCKDCKFYVPSEHRFKARCNKIIEPELKNEFNGTIYQSAVICDLVSNSNGDCKFFEKKDE